MLSSRRLAGWSARSATLLVAVAFAACSLNTKGELDTSGGEGGEEQGGSAGEGGEGQGGYVATGGKAGQGGSSTGGASGQGGSSTGGASGQGGSSTGGASGQGGSTVEKDCLDGHDNDGDGTKDCEDGDCKANGFGCVELPSGWQGFFRTRVGDFANAPAPLACPGGAAPSRRYLDPASAAECSPCSCSWEGGSCGYPKLACSGQNSSCYNAGLTFPECSGCCTVDTDGWPDTPVFSCFVTETSVTHPGTCKSAGISDFPNKDSWKRVLDACAVPSTASGCTSGWNCLSPDVGGYDTGVCVRHDGDVSCPPTWTKKALSYVNAMDTRGCSACACGAPSGVKCTGGSYRFHDTDYCGDCYSCSSPVTVAGACVDLSSHADHYQFSFEPLTQPTASGGLCAASGGDVIGSMTPIGPETWCCK